MTYAKVVADIIRDAKDLIAFTGTRISTNAGTEDFEIYLNVLEEMQK